MTRRMQSHRIYFFKAETIFIQGTDRLVNNILLNLNQGRLRMELI